MFVQLSVRGRAISVVAGVADWDAAICADKLPELGIETQPNTVHCLHIVSDTIKDSLVYLKYYFLRLDRFFFNGKFMAKCQSMLKTDVLY